MPRSQPCATARRALAKQIKEKDGGYNEKNAEAANSKQGCRQSQRDSCQYQSDKKHHAKNQKSRQLPRRQPNRFHQGVHWVFLLVVIGFSRAIVCQI
jgi:hypothetical protein